jgi:hypothetical protein
MLTMALLGSFSFERYLEMKKEEREETGVFGETRNAYERRVNPY